MKKMFLAMLLSSMAVVGLSSTHSETNVADPIRNEITAKRAMSTNGVYTPSYKYMAISTVVDDHTHDKSVKSNPDTLRAITSSDILIDSTKSGGSRVLKLSANNSLGVRYTTLAGDCTLSFKVKMTQANSQFRVFMDHYDLKGDQAWYAYQSQFSGTPKLNEWVELSYSFRGNASIFENGVKKHDSLDSKGLSLSVTAGEFYFDDFKVTDGAGYNYFCDGDFEPIDCLQWSLINIGVAKQTDGSVLFGFNRWNIIDSTIDYNDGKEEYAQTNCTKSSTSTTVSAKFIGNSFLIGNRAGFDWENTDHYNYKNTIDEGKWQDYEKVLVAAPLGTGFYFGQSIDSRALTFFKDISIKNENGEEMITNVLTKEGYAASLAESLLTYIVCNENGNYGSDHLSKWGTLSYCYSSLTNPCKEYIKSLANTETGDDTFKEAIARYRIFVTNYGYSDFLGLGIKTNTSLYTPGMLNDSSIVALYATLGFTVAGAGIATFLIVRKKKKA